MRYLKYFSKKTIILTGAASGIGKELATLLNNVQPVLFLIDLNAEDLNKLVKELQVSNPNVYGRVLNVADAKDYENFANEFSAKGLSPDFLFNNAGIGIGGEIKDFTLESWRKIMDVNFFGTVNGIHFFYPMMIAQKSGHIINTSSLAGLLPLPGEASYVASKYAIQGLTETLETEAFFYNIKVTAVCPGVVQTPIYDTGEVIGFDKKTILDLWPKGISAEQCAEIILKGVSRKESIIVVTAFARSAFFLKQTFPSLLKIGFREYFNKVRESKSHN
jgi:short-subunit dehydrogenase